jgi:hypothetical protein
LLGSKLGRARFRFLKDLVILFLVLIEEVGNIEEGVAFEADIYERRLHSREHATDAALVNTTYQANVGISFKIHLDELVVFEHGHFCLVRRRGNIHLLRHENSFFRNAGESIRQLTEIDQQRSKGRASRLAGTDCFDLGRTNGIGTGEFPERAFGRETDWTNPACDLRPNLAGKSLNLQNRSAGMCEPCLAGKELPSIHISPRSYAHRQS